LERAAVECIAVVSGRFVVVIIEWLCAVRRSNTSRYDDDMVLVSQLRYARISARLLYPYLLCVCSSLAYVVPPPTPTRNSSVDEVKAWLGWFGKRTKLPEDKITLLQEAFAVDGERLLRLSKKECIDICKEDRFKAIIGTSLYGELHARTVL